MDKDFMMGNTLGAVSYLQILAPELTDRMLAEFLDMDRNLIVNLHIQSLDQMKAIKLVKSKVTDINRMKIEEQKKAVRSGYDMDIIPSDLNTYGGEAKRLLEDLQSRNERMFLVTIVFLNTAKTKQELDNAVFQTAGIAQKYNCSLRRLDYMQEPGLMSSLPLGLNLIPIKRALTTTSTAIFVPFTTQELFMEGESLYYGLNALSNNMIMVDRKKLKNPNGLILGTPGSGKSFSAKREITNAFFVTQDDIIIGDPEGEYYPLVNALGGQVIHISPQEEASGGEGTPFSIPGNGEVLDDKSDDGTKEFLTIQTKNGNTFFLVLDRSNNTENVYMLSMIDENDLAEFMDETQTEEMPQVVIPETETTVAPEETEPETVQPEEDGGMNTGALLAIGLLAAGGIGTGYYFKVVKPKKDEAQEDGEDLEFYDGGTYVNEDQMDEGDPAEEENEKA